MATLYTAFDVRPELVMAWVDLGPQMAVFRHPVLPKDHGFKPGDRLMVEGEGDEARIYKVSSAPPPPRTIVLPKG